jgi:hypothetical protein
MNKLTDRHKAALVAIASMPNQITTGYDLKCKGLGHTGTLRQLASRGLVAPIGRGHMAFPQNGTYALTKNGKKLASNIASLQRIENANDPA